MRKKGFTLVEVLVVVAIAGIVIVTAVSPLVYTVRAIGDAQKRFSQSNRERLAVNRIFLDAREVVNLQAGKPFLLVRKDELGNKADDALILWTKTPAYGGEAMACVVYRTLPKSILDGNGQEGLYRWVLSQDHQPETIEDSDLTPEKGRLFLPGVQSVRFSALENSDWVDDYAGRSPQALRVTLKKEEEETVYEGWLPQF